MFQLRQLTVAIAIMAVAVSGVYASHSPDWIVQHKMDTIQPALDMRTSLADQYVLRDAARRALALDTITIRPDNQVVLPGVASAPYDVFAIADENKLVVDLYGTINIYAGQTTVPEQSSLVKQVRTSLYAFEPMFVSRLVFDLSDYNGHMLLLDGDNLVIDLAPSANGVSEKSREALRAQIDLACRKEKKTRNEAAIEYRRGISLQDAELRRVALRSDLDWLTAVASQDRPVPAANLDTLNLALANMHAVTTSLTDTEFLLDATPRMAALGDSLVESSDDTPEAERQLGDMERSSSAAPAVAPLPPVKRAASQSDVHMEVSRGHVANLLDQRVDLQFRQMELSNVVALLADQAQINVVGGDDLSGTVTASLHDIPLRQALETVLRRNNFGLVEEDGIYHIVPYEEAIAINQTQQIVALKNARSAETADTLTKVATSFPDSEYITVAANENANVVIISGPKARTEQLAAIARELDIAEPKTLTVTEAIQTNYANPKDLVPMVEGILTPEVGSVESDERGRNLIVTDVPVVVEQVRALVQAVDQRVKQVSIEAMIVDARLTDAAQTGVDWLLSAMPGSTDINSVDFGMGGNLFPRSDSGEPEYLDDGSRNIGDVLLSNVGALGLSVLGSDVAWSGIIQAQVANRDAEILATPHILTVENQSAKIDIVQEFPYQEITQSTTGPPVSSTEFKQIGVTLEVTPQVTHNNEIISKIATKQSSVQGFEPVTGVPIEAKRFAETTVHTQDGQTILIAGLRRTDSTDTVTKIPVLGDIPGLGFMFKNNEHGKENTELLVFVTSHVMPEIVPELTPTEQEKFDKLSNEPELPDGERAMFHNIVKPSDTRDPAWKWRRAK